MEERKLPPIIREKVLEYYGLDVAEARMFFSTRNYAFIFPDGKTVIRVCVTGTAEGRGSALSEVMWVDELRRYSSTICAPIPSLRSNHIEEFEDANTIYRVARFEQAKGRQLTDAGKIDNWFFIHLGDTVGRIHRASKEAEEAGIHYKRPEWADLPLFHTETAIGMSEELKKKCQEIIDAVKTLQKSTDNFGMVHGDITINNYYVDINNIWVFDFDDCNYNYYMYDIGTALSAWLFSSKNRPEVERKKLLYEEGMLDSFKMGYERHIQLPKEEWEHLELFMKLRFVYMNIIMNSMDTSAMISDVSGMQKMLAMLIMNDDIYAGLNLAVQMMAKMQFTNYSAGAEDNLEALESVEQNENNTIMTIKGKLDSNTSPQIQKEIDSLIEKGCSSMTIDCGQMIYMSSAGIRVLLSAYKKLEGRLKLSNVPENVQEVLNITGLSDNLFKEEK